MEKLFESKILVVDDSEQNLLLMEGVLSMLDVEPDLVSSGAEALKKLQQHEYALIISDIQMPEMSGFELLDEIRKQKAHQTTPVIFISGNFTDEADIIRGIKTGAIDYISKPFNSQILLGKVRLFLQLYEQKKKMAELIQSLEEKNIELSRERLFIEKITDGVADAIIMTDETENIVFWNKAAATIFGFEEAEVLNRNIHTLIFPEYQNNRSIKPFIRSDTEKHSTIQMEFVSKNKGGAVIPTEMTISSLQIDEKTFLVGIVRDISDRKEKELNLLKALQEQEANQAKSEFLANMSHEFRTPMNAIIGITKALLKYDSANLNEEQRQGLTHILQSGTRLLDLVNDLLDLAKIESKKMTVSLKPFMLEKLLTDLKSTTEQLIQEKKIAFTVRKSRNIPEILVSDQKKLYGILQNLLSNSVKFTESGKIHLHLYKLKSRLHFEVADTGIGISKDNIDIVFEKFAQIDSSAQKKYKGTGLGLALCKEMVTLLNGKIGLDSEPGEGTIVRFYIPFLEAPGLEESSLDMALPLLNENPKKRVLIIEDDPELRYYFEKYLQHENLLFEFSPDGKKGLEKIREAHPNIIILDLKLPVMTGFEVLRILKFDKDLWSIPVIIISEMDDPPNETSYNFEVFLHKPIDEKLLLSYISQITSIKKTNKDRVLIIDENLVELKFLKKVLNDLRYSVATLSESRKARMIIEKFEPDILIIDLDNFVYNITEMVKILLSHTRGKKMLIIFYAEKIEQPELITFIHYKDEVAVVLKSAKAPNSFHRILGRSLGDQQKTIKKKTKILIADDDPECIHTLKMLLKDSYDLVFAHDGLEALEVFMFEKPDMVLMDIKMPRMNGFLAFDEIRKRSTRIHVPIIAVTAHAMQEEKERILSHGFNDYLPKPIDDELLIETIQKYIKKPT